MERLIPNDSHSVMDALTIFTRASEHPSEFITEISGFSLILSKIWKEKQSVKKSAKQKRFFISNLIN